jgi:hypothetical protein
MNITSRVLKGLMLTLIIMSSSCASSASNSLLPLESRTLDICQDLTGFCWQYKRCTKRILGICMKSEMAVDKIEVEFKDSNKAKQLYDMNFILKVREKPL